MNGMEKIGRVVNRFLKDDSFVIQDTLNRKALEVLSFMKEEGLDYSQIIFTTLSILAVSSNISEASDKLNEKFNFRKETKIEWILGAVDKVSPLYIAEYQKEKLEVRDEKTMFTEEERNVLAWNIYHEARSKDEGEEGKLGVLLSVFERMISPNYPSSSQGVVFQKDQYSWTRDVKKGLHEKRNEHEISFYEARKFVDQYTSGGVRRGLEDIYIKLKSLKGMEIPRKLTHYHKQAGVNSDHFKNANLSTKKRILVINELYGKDKNIILLGTQLYYPAKYGEKDFIEQKFKDLGLKI